MFPNKWKCFYEEAQEEIEELENLLSSSRKKMLLYLQKVVISENYNSSFKKISKY